MTSVTIVKHVTFSPDGKLLAVGTTIGIWLYDAETFEVIRFINTDSWADRLIFAPDGRQLFARVGITAIAMWEIANGKLVHWIDLGDTVKAYRIGDVPLVAISGDKPQVELRNMQNGTLVKAQSGFADAVFVAAFSPDGSLLAVGLRDQTIQVWDIQTDAVLSIPTGHGSLIECLAFTPDGRFLASGAIDKTVRLWDTRTGKPVHIMEGHLATVSSLAFSPDGKTLASGAQDRTIKLWDVETGSLIHTLADSISFVETLAFTPDGKVLASSGRFDETVQLWDVGMGKPVETLVDYGEVWAQVISPANVVFATSGNEIQLWNINTGRQERTIKGHKDDIFFLALSADGKTLASCERAYRGVWVWDLVTETWTQIETGFDCWGTGLSPDGQLVAVAVTYRTSWVYDVQSGERLNIIGSGSSLLFSADGKRLITGPSGGIDVWDAPAEERLVYINLPGGSIRGMAVSPNDKLAAAGDTEGVIHLVDLEKGKIIRRLEGLAGDIVSVAFSPDGAIAAACVESGRARPLIGLWDVQAGELLSVPVMEKHSVHRIFFTPDGTLLLSVGGDGVTRLWGIPPSR